jgi:hypothetical protein
MDFLFYVKNIFKNFVFNEINILISVSLAMALTPCPLPPSSLILFDKGHFEKNY